MLQNLPSRVITINTCLGYPRLAPRISVSCLCSTIVSPGAPRLFSLRTACCQAEDDHGLVCTPTSSRDSDYAVRGRVVHRFSGTRDLLNDPIPRRSRRRPASCCCFVDQRAVLIVLMLWGQGSWPRSFVFNLASRVSVPECSGTQQTASCYGCSSSCSAVVLVVHPRRCYSLTRNFEHELATNRLGHGRRYARRSIFFLGARPRRLSPWPSCHHHRLLSLRGIA